MDDDFVPREIAEQIIRVYDELFLSWRENLVKAITKIISGFIPVSPEKLEVKLIDELKLKGLWDEDEEERDC